MNNHIQESLVHPGLFFINKNLFFNVLNHCFIRKKKRFILNLERTKSKYVELYLAVLFYEQINLSDDKKFKRTNLCIYTSVIKTRNMSN